MAPLMMLNWIERVSASAPAVRLRMDTRQLPAATESTMMLYAPAVAPLTIEVVSVSLTAIWLLVRVKLTAVLAAIESAVVVIRPEGLFSVTAVALLVACVTVPPEPTP